MQHRALSFTIALIVGLTPVLADTTSNMSVAPSNAQYVNPTTNQNASTANVSTQINNQNLGANAYGPGVTCQGAQLALGGYGSRLSTGIGPADANTGVTVQYLTPVGSQGTKSCQALADEIVRQHQLDTQLTYIQKCADFARAGITLDPRVYPQLAHQCEGIHVLPAASSSAPIGAYPRANGAYLAPRAKLTYQAAHKVKIALHLSDFSPEHNSELRRIALHREQRIEALRMALRSPGLSAHERQIVAAHLLHEKTHLLAVIAEYDSEHSDQKRFQDTISTDSSWHANSDLRTRILDTGN